MVRSPIFPNFSMAKMEKCHAICFFPGLRRHVHHCARAIGEFGAGGEARGQAEVDQLPGRRLRNETESLGKNGKMMGKHGKKLENDGETMGNPRKMMGKHGKKWENDGETMGNPRKMDGESLK